jgi:carbon storage regulator
MEDYRMLVLSRKVGEKILIGDDITITVVDIGPGRVKLGIAAPADHRILRSELVFDLEETSASHDSAIGRIRTETSRHQPARSAEPVVV